MTVGVSLRASASAALRPADLDLTGVSNSVGGRNEKGVEDDAAAGALVPGPAWGVGACAVRFLFPETRGAAFLAKTGDDWGTLGLCSGICAKRIGVGPRGAAEVVRAALAGTGVEATTDDSKSLEPILLAAVEEGLSLIHI